jgi:hypothetical protein
MLQSFFIPGWHPAPLNKLIGNQFAANKLKKHDKDQIARAKLAYNLEPATKKRRVDLVMFLGKGQRAIDPDSPLKSLNDALVANSLICNDSYIWVENRPTQFVRVMGDAVPGTMVILEDV